MKTNKLIIQSIAVTLLVVGLSACNSTTTKNGSAVVNTTAATEKAEAPVVEKPAGFLETDYAVLDEWMNERYKIEYRAQTPEGIFDEVPLSDIHYNTSNMPTNAPKFYFESESVSRRELLQAVAEHWNLKMEYEIGEEGNPSAVNVSG